MELGREEAKGVPGGRKEGREEERGEGKAGAGLLLGGRESTQRRNLYEAQLHYHRAGKKMGLKLRGSELIDSTDGVKSHDSVQA